MAETKTKRPKAKPTDGRIATFSEDAFWLSLAAKMAGISQAEFVRRRFRDCLRSELEGNGIDPDRAFTKAAKEGATA